MKCDESEHEDDELTAADKFRQSVLAIADCNSHSGPMWFGWVIVEAFLAGVRWSKKTNNK